MTVRHFFSITLFLCLLLIKPVWATTFDVGDSPSGIAVDAALNKIYVSNQNNGTVLVYDNSTYELLETIELNKQYATVILPSILLVNPNTHTVYVAAGSGALYAFDGNTYEVSDPLSLWNISAMQLDAKNNKLYVQGYAIGEQNNFVYTIDTTTFTQVAKTTVYNSQANGSFAINPDNGTLYYPNVQPYGNVGTSATLTIQPTEGPSSELTLAGGIGGLAFNANTNKLYVSTYGWAIAIIDANSNEIIDTISLPSGSTQSYNMAIDETKNQIYVNSNSVIFVIDGFTNQIKAQLPAVNSAGVSSAGIAFDSQTNTLYSINWNPEYKAISPTAMVLNNTFNPAPEILSIPSPETAAGEQLIITGQYFSYVAAENLVHFPGGATVAAEQSDGTTITVTVPVTAQSGPISLSVNGTQSETFTEQPIQIKKPSTCQTIGKPSVFEPIALPQGTNIVKFFNDVNASGEYLFAMAKSTAGQYSLLAINPDNYQVTTVANLITSIIEVAYDKKTLTFYYKVHLDNNLYSVNNSLQVSNTALPSPAGLSFSDLSIDQANSKLYVLYSIHSPQKFTTNMYVYNTTDMTQAPGNITLSSNNENNPTQIEVDENSGVVYVFYTGRTYQMDILDPEAGYSTVYSESLDYGGTTTFYVATNLADDLTYITPWGGSVVAVNDAQQGFVHAGGLPLSNSLDGLIFNETNQTLYLLVDKKKFWYYDDELNSKGEIHLTDKNTEIAVNPLMNYLFALSTSKDTLNIANAATNTSLPNFSWVSKSELSSFAISNINNMAFVGTSNNEIETISWCQPDS